MPYKISNREIEQLKSLIGKRIYTGGTCVAQDEYGVAHHCPTAHFTGILRKINYNEDTKKLDSIVLECASGTEEVFLDTTPGSHVWDIEKGIYHEGQLILEVSS